MRSKRRKGKSKKKDEEQLRTIVGDSQAISVSQDDREGMGDNPVNQSQQSVKITLSFKSNGKFAAQNLTPTTISLI